MKYNTIFIVFWSLTILCFITGITLPAFKMNITFGSFWIDAIIEALLPHGSIGSNRLTILGSIWKLLSHGEMSNIILGSLILLFSVIFPAFKYFFLFKSFIRSNESSLSKLLSKYGYWSMLDVFVIAVLVVSFKGFPGGSRIIPEIGIYFFFASVVLSHFSHKILVKWLHTKVTES